MPRLQPAHHITLRVDAHGSWVWKHFGGLIYPAQSYFSTKKVLRGCLRRSQSLIWQCCCLSWTLTLLQHLVVHPWPPRLSGVRYISPHGQVKKDMSAWSAPSASFKISSFCKRRSFVANPNHEGFCISWLYTFLHRGLKGLSKTFLHSVANIKLDSCKKNCNIFESALLSKKRLLCCCPHHHLLLQG